MKRDMLQGDVLFVDALARMGCIITESAEGIAVGGRPLRITPDDGPRHSAARSTAHPGTHHGRPDRAPASRFDGARNESRPAQRRTPHTTP